MSGFNIHSLTRRIDLFTLSLFLTVVEEQQVRRAALRENVTPSAATRRILDLEDVAGLPLFGRLPGGMVPSAAGEVLARHVRLRFANRDVMRREVSEFTEGARGHIRVSSTSTIIVHFLAREIGGFMRDFPLADIEQLRNAATALGRDLRIKYSVSTMEAARALVKAELGVTIQPESMLSNEDLDKVMAVPLDESWVHWQICVGTTRGEILTAATKALVMQLTDR
ncbi:DNA-binding transcriptional LysR family regulator [Paraburkholderia atlantica]|uniref:LysR family transcriptional regulator n=1 Tax=Paraburkholderia atlantica TaxID=2654982 RepID=UPI00128C14DF|nr:LysR substrate-binding domain-containing protein [Paraburkholderia atlantica]MPW08298.1 LysR family transcriptional regulator [Paraburkholderia atlantica]